jgi:hypothetical protein
MAQLSSRTAGSGIENTGENISVVRGDRLFYQFEDIGPELGEVDFSDSE